MTRTSTRCAPASRGRCCPRCCCRSACRCCSAATSSAAPRAATTTPTARTTRPPGSTGRRADDELRGYVQAAARAAPRAPGLPPPAVPDRRRGGRTRLVQLRGPAELTDEQWADPTMHADRGLPGRHRRPRRGRRRHAAARRRLPHPGQRLLGAGHVHASRRSARRRRPGSWNWTATTPPSPPPASSRGTPAIRWWPAPAR